MFKKEMLNQKVALETRLRPGPWSRLAGTAAAAGHARAPAGPPRRAGPAASDADEVTDTLSRLADLRDRGAISADDYEAKKAELLGRL